MTNEKDTKQLIEDELENAGIRKRFKGYTFLVEAIYIQISSEEDPESAIGQVADKYKQNHEDATKIMQNAISDACNYFNWPEVMTPSELIQNFSAKIKQKSN